MQMENERKYALLIDADNISPRYIDVVMKETVALGVATFRRIYADWTDVSKESWKKVLLDNSLTPVQQYSYTYGKNSSDSAMIIDAMDILYTGDVDGFILVTSDSDFTRLASRLRESGKQVIGMGESKTPAPFVKACELFKTLDVLSGREKSAGQKAPGRKESSNHTKKQSQPEKGSLSEKNNPTENKKQENRKKAEELRKAQEAVRQEEARARTEEAVKADEMGQAEEKATTITRLSEIKNFIKGILDEHSDDDGWMFLGDIGNMLIKSYPAFDPRNYGYKKVREMFEAQPEFEVKSKMSSNRRTRLVYIKSKEKPM